MTLEEVKELLKLSPEDQIKHDKYVNGFRIRMNICKFLYKNFIGLSLISLLLINILVLYLTIILIISFLLLSLLSYVKYNYYRTRYAKANMSDEDYYYLLKSLENPNFDPKEESDKFMENK